MRGSRVYDLDRYRGARSVLDCFRLSTIKGIRFRGTEGEGKALLFGSAGSFSGRKRENWTVFVVELGENRERFVKKVAGEQSAGVSYGVVNLSQCFDSHSNIVGL